MKTEINIIQTSENFMYLVKGKALGYDLAEDWILFWTFSIPISLILNLYYKENLLIYKGLLFLILIFALTIIRRNIVSSFKYLSASVLIIFLAFIISFTLIEKALFFTPMIFCLIISIKKRGSEVINFWRISILLYIELLMVICYFVAFNYNLTTMMSLINFASINVAITLALYVCISRMASFMEWEGEFIKGYSKRMVGMRLSCIAFISTVILFFIILARSIGLYKLFDVLTSKILSFFNSKPPVQSLKINVPNSPTISIDSLNNPLNNLQPTGKSNYLMSAIFKVAQMIFFIALFFLIIYLLFVLVTKVKNFYMSLSHKKPYKKEQREFVISIDDIIAKIKQRFKIELNLPINMSNRKKIRKLYHKLIKSYKIKGILAYSFNTPLEIESKVSEMLGKNISEATIIYEKARYSDAECSVVDVDKMKSFFNSQ